MINIEACSSEQTQTLERILEKIRKAYVEEQAPHTPAISSELSSPALALPQGYRFACAKVNEGSSPNAL